MAKKELTEDDILKKQYSSLVKINQRLKNISEGYYISHDGTIHMKSLVDFIEKIVVLHDVEVIDRFLGSMIMPNAFFNFTKKAKKSKLIITPTNTSYHLGQEDDEELTYTINVVNANKEIDMNYTKANIIPKMYKRFFELESDMYEQFPDKDEFHPLTEEETENIIKANPVYLLFHDHKLTLTKHLCLDIKKGDTLSLARYCRQKLDGKHYRVFYMLKHETELYTDYTIFNTLQS